MPATPAGAAATPTGTTPAAAAITIKGFRYVVPASVAPGAMVTVTNGDSENHTLTADTTGGFDVKAAAGAPVTFAAPSKPGSYHFHCTYHANMHGVLIVG
jgi:plastocyanin